MVYADPYTFSEWDRTMNEILSDPIADPPLRLLVDHRSCQAPALMFVRHMGEYVRRHRDRFRGGAIAIVSGDTSGYAIARMTEMLIDAKQVPCEVRAFREWDDAEQWLEGVR